LLATSSISILNVNDGNGVASQEVTYAISQNGMTPPGTPMTDGNTPITDTNGKPLLDGDWSTTIPENIP